MEWLFFNEILHIQKRKPGLTQNQLRIFAAEHHPMHSFVFAGMQPGEQTDEMEQVWVHRSLKTTVKLAPEGDWFDWKLTD